MAGSLAASLLANRLPTTRKSASSAASGPPNSRKTFKTMSTVHKVARQSRSPKALFGGPTLMPRQRSKGKTSSSKSASLRPQQQQQQKAKLHYLERINEEQSDDARNLFAPRPNAVPPVPRFSTSTRNEPQGCTFASLLVGRGKTKKRDRDHSSDEDEEEEDSFLLGDSYNGRAAGMKPQPPQLASPLHVEPVLRQVGTTDDSSSPAPRVPNGGSDVPVTGVPNKGVSLEEEKTRLATVKSFKVGTIDSYGEAGTTAGDSHRAAADDLAFFLTHSVLDLTKTLDSALERGIATSKEQTEQANTNLNVLLQKLEAAKQKSLHQANLYSKAVGVRDSRMGIIMEELRCARDKDLEVIQTLTESWDVARNDLSAKIDQAVSDKEAKKEKNKQIALILNASNNAL